MSKRLVLITVFFVGFVLTLGAGTVGAQSAPDCSQVSYSGDGTESNPYEVGNVDELQCIENQGLNANYVQVSRIDALKTAVWNGGSGFEPIGEAFTGTRFNGTFDGDGHEITGLTIDRRSKLGGLFGSIGSPGTVTNVSVKQTDITGNGGAGLVVINDGTVRSSSVSGTIVTNSGNDLGGLVAVNAGSVRNSSASADVSGVSKIGGGLVGRNRGGIVRGSSASGDVTGAEIIGGLVGFNDGGIVRDSSASGVITGSNIEGGLVGYNNGIVQNSSASGDVTGNKRVGGLVGENIDTVEKSSASGKVEGDKRVGGLVGENGDTIQDSSATGNVTGNESVGGLVGFNIGTLEKSYARGAVVGFEKDVGGLVGKNGESGDSGTVSESYATGQITGPLNLEPFPDPIFSTQDTSSGAGGLIGNNSDGTVTDSYWDVNATGYNVSGGGTGLTTEEMTGTAAESNMVGFDFTSTWETVTGDYPELAWELDGKAGDGGNPFLTDNGDPVSRGDVVSDIGNWLATDQIDRTTYTRDEVVSFIGDWLAA